MTDTAVQVLAGLWVAFFLGIGCAAVLPAIEDVDQIIETEGGEIVLRTLLMELVGDIRGELADAARGRMDGASGAG